MGVRINQNAPDIYQLLESGIFPEFTRVKKFGRANNAPNGVWSTVWDGNSEYPYSDVNITGLYAVSAEAADTQIIRIEGVDEDFKYQKEEIQLNGLTQVPLTKEFMLIYRIENMSPTGLTGEVQIRTATTIYGYILNGGNDYNQSQMAVMVVPSGYYGLVTRIGSSIGGTQSGEINYRSKVFGEAWKTKRPYDLRQNAVPEDVGFFFPEKTILDVRVKPGNNVPVSAWFDIILVEKDAFEFEFGKPQMNGLKRL